MCSHTYEASFCKSRDVEREKARAFDVQSQSKQHLFQFSSNPFPQHPPTSSTSSIIHPSTGRPPRAAVTASPCRIDCSRPPRPGPKFPLPRTQHSYSARQLFQEHQYPADRPLCSNCTAIAPILSNTHSSCPKALVTCVLSRAQKPITRFGRVCCARPD